MKNLFYRHGFGGLTDRIIEMSGNNEEETDPTVDTSIKESASSYKGTGSKQPDDRSTREILEDLVNSVQ